MIIEICASQNTQSIIINSWRDSTRKQYKVYITKWLNYCGREGNPLKPDATTVVQFLSNLFDTGLSYTAINTARSAISTFVKITGNIDIHKNEIINRFMKGVHNERPMLPRYTHTWDVNLVLTYVENMDSTSLLSLSKKLSMLFWLTTAQRCQSLHVLKTSDIIISTLDVTITFNSILKTTRPGSHQKPIKIRRYNNEKLCIVNTLEQYLTRTQFLRNDDFLLISTIKGEGWS